MRIVAHGDQDKPGAARLHPRRRQGATRKAQAQNGCGSPTRRRRSPRNVLPQRPLRRCGRLWTLTNSLLHHYNFSVLQGARDSRSDVESRRPQARDLHRIRTSSAAGGDILADPAVKLGWRLLLPQLLPPQLRNPSEPFDPSVRSVGHFATEPGQGHSFRDRGGTKQAGQFGLFFPRPASLPLSFWLSGLNHSRPHSSDPTAPLLSPRSEQVRDGRRPGLVISLGDSRGLRVGRVLMVSRSGPRPSRRAKHGRGG